MSTTKTMKKSNLSTGTRTDKMVTMAMLCTLAYVVMYFCRIPIWSFLKYDPKDVVIVIAGFIYGPLSACLISLVVSVLEMLLVSETGPIGMIMNVLSTCAFACTASFIYSKTRTKTGAIVGLAAGIAVVVPVMLLWNYIVTPLYMEMTRELVAGMLVPIFLPFNIFKGGLNMAITLMLYKPIITALRKANLLPDSRDGALAGKQSRGLALLGLAILVTVILTIMVLSGKF